MSKSSEGYRYATRASLLTVLALTGCAKAIQGEAGPVDVSKDSVSAVRTTETSAPLTTTASPSATPSSKLPKACIWSESKPQPFTTTNPQAGITLTPECTLKPTDPIKMYEQPDENSSITVEFSPKGELAVGVHCVAEGPEVEGINGPSSSWIKAEAVVNKEVQVGYFAGPAVGYALLNTSKVDHC